MPMVPGECRENQEQRVTVDSMGCRVFQERKETGVRREHWVHPGLQEKMEKGEMTERLDPEDCLVNLVPEDSLAHEDLQAHQDNPVLLVWMGLRVQKGTWGLKESPVLLASRASQDHKVYPDLKVPSDLPELRVLRVKLVCPASRELMGLQATQAKRGRLVRKVRRDLPARKVRLAIQDLEE